MSAPNPTHIDVIVEHAYLVEYGQVCCSCGWESETVNAESEHAAHVVSKLTDAGYSIVPSEGIVRTYQAASTLGRRYMSPKTFGCDREEAERWFELHQSALEGLPGVDTVRLEYRDEFAAGWLPLLAAAAEGDINA